MSQSSDQDSVRKASPFDNLTRDDLVKKCKGLLGIAQKAKQAKDECQEENRRLMEQLSHFETQKNADKECIKAMQEVADTYMDQRLQATMKVDELEKQLKHLNAQLMSERKAHDELNEQLRAEMAQLKIQLEQKDTSNDIGERFNELQEENVKIEKERVALEQELIRVKGSQKVLGDTTATPREEKLIRKLKLYKAKVQEINAKLLLLKSDRKILLKTVKEYSEQVPKWQKDLMNASNVLFEKIRTIELEKSDLMEQLGEYELKKTQLQQDNTQLERKIAELTNNLEQQSTVLQDQTDGIRDAYVKELQEEIDHLKTHISSIESERQQEHSEFETKLKQDSDEKEVLRKDLQDANHMVSEMEAKIQSQTSTLSESIETQKNNDKELEQCKKQIECFETEVKQLQELLQKELQKADHYNEFQESCRTDLASLNGQLAESEKEQRRLRDELTSLSATGDDKSNVLLAQLDAVQQKLTAIEEENESLNKNVETLTADARNQASKMAEENQQVMQKLVTENQNLETQLAQLADKLKASIGKTKQSMERCGILEKESDSAKLVLEAVNNEKNRLLENLKQVQIQDQQNVSKIAELENALEQLKQTQKQNANAVENELRRRVQQLEEQLTSINEQYDRLKTENAELLSELKEINEMLKDRGEVINLQLSKMSELQDKLSRVEAVDVEPLKQQIDELQGKLKEKDAELERQRDELTTAMNRSSISFDAQSDIMSTSTISRVEDVARLREIDESYEEKYIKLRSLAVKLKKKVAEQTVLLQKYEKDPPVPLTTASDAAQQTVNKNLQTLQAENDRLQDQLESTKQEATKLRAESDKKSIELTTLQQIQQDVANTSKDHGALETAIREYQTQIQNLKREKDAFQLAKREIDAENQRLKSSIKTKDKELADGQEHQKELKSELERSKLAVKKANVLTLEMEAYERSLSELNSKLETKKTLVKELEETIDAQEHTMKSLKQQLVLSEESLESQQKHSRELKQEVDMQQGKLRQSEHQRMELSNQLEELREQHDRLKQRVENNRVELEQVAAEKEKVCGSLEVEKNTLLKQNLTMDGELNELRKEITAKQQELDDVRTEFASYKIRAQSVLRQNQSKDGSREKELGEELSLLQRSMDAVEAKQQSLLKQVGDLSKNNEELKNERERTQNRCKELLALLEECRLQNESLLDESRKVNVEHQEALKTHRIQSETLVQCYKKQLEEQQESHGREMEQLQMTLKNHSQLPTDSMNVMRGNVQNNNNLHNPSGGPVTSSGRGTFTDEQRINLLLMEREDGEGSESTSLGGGTGITVRRKLSASSMARGRTSRDVVPLDELLNSSFDDTASVVLVDGDGDQSLGQLFGRDSSPTVELQHTKEQLIKQESRVRHLTAVLAEAEQDLAKLTELNELLKEEVRRQQRSIEREAHVHNSEYLKNVIFKFITLNNGDERSRLVPVLNTILKLSPEETQKLQNVAKGSDAGARGWTGILWS